MPEFRLSERAERDLIEIYDYTEEAFGAYQAEAYHAGLERMFDLLANFPRIGQVAAEIVPGLRRFRFQSHNVFYTEEADFHFDPRRSASSRKDKTQSLRLTRAAISEGAARSIQNDCAERGSGATLAWYIARLGTGES